MMKRARKAAAIAAVAGVMAGCSGGGGSTPAAVSGVVADGYLVNAVVFQDRNGNYQWDEGEPKAVTGPGGAYSLQVAPQDVAKYPVVVSVVAGQTIDEDTGQPVTTSYVLSAPPQFPQVVTPFSSLLREKLANGSYSSVQQAVDELKTQLNMPNADILADYVKLGQSNPQSQYAKMHRVAQAMAGIMGRHLGSAGMSANGYKYIMGQINTDLPNITEDVLVTGLGMTQMLTKYDWISGMPMKGGFGNYSSSGFLNYSSMFRNHGGGTFWNYSGGNWTPRNGPMMGGSGRNPGMGPGGGMMK
jgi:hypothetical protein